jgi:hypothetical protein
MCPSVTKLLDMASEIRKREGCEGIILVPDWPTANFYGGFFEKEGVTRWPFELVDQINPYIYQNQGAKGPLNGKINFKINVLYFYRF